MFHLQKYELDLVCKPGKSMFLSDHLSKIVNEYDQEIPQSQTADNKIISSRVE